MTLYYNGREPLVYVDRYGVCPRRHGRLRPTDAWFRRTPEYKARKIVQSAVMRGKEPFINYLEESP